MHEQRGFFQGLDSCDVKNCILSYTFKMMDKLVSRYIAY